MPITDSPADSAAPLDQLLAELEATVADRPAARAVMVGLLAAEALPTASIRALSRAASRRAGRRAPRRTAPDSLGVRAAPAAVAAAVRAERLSARTIVDLHAATAGADGVSPGLRTSDIRVHWTPADRIVFDGASPRLLPDALETVAATAGDAAGDPVDRALAAYADLTSVHPFADGNGRVSRLLVQVVLRRRGVLAAAAVPFGAMLALMPDVVVDGTRAWRDGDRDGWLEPARDVLRTACETATQLATAAG